MPKSSSKQKSPSKHGSQEVTSDLSSLSDPKVEQVTAALEQRYRHDRIYTYIGDILLSVNPNHPVPIYGDQVGNSYRHVHESARLEPHIFMTACRALCYLQLHNRNQAVLLLGESGTGKSEVVKMLTSQFGRLSSGPRRSRTGIILSEALLLLEAFGNADTGINPNSSRFGKLVDFYWDGKTLIGGKIRVQGLELGRVMLPGPGERNFHIFYQLIAGMSPDMLRRHQHNQSYRILETFDGGPMFSNQDDMDFHHENFQYLTKCLDAIGILNKTFRSSRVTAGAALFEILSALLHLGNLHFSPDPGSDVAFIANSPELETAADLLGLPVQDLGSHFMQYIQYIRGQRVSRTHDVSGASKSRNAFVRYLYLKLFHWLVEEINVELSPTGHTRHQQFNQISVLDLPGFECQKDNGLEQLLHNLADERLQNLVTDSVFRQELDDFEMEGVKRPKLKFADNTDVLDAFYTSNIGLLGLIDQFTDVDGNGRSQLIDIIQREITRRSPVVKTDNSGKTFMILHHRGQVIYNVDMVVRRNLPMNEKSIDTLLEYSKNPVVLELISKTSNSENNVDDQTTAVQKYAMSLREVFREVEDHEKHHVWCIRPSMSSQPGVFDQDTVRRQMVAMNVVEAASLRGHGYPVRIPLEEFLHRYRFIGCPLTARIQSIPGACQHVMRRAGLPEGGWEVRRHKVFLSWWHLDRLDTALERVLYYVIFVQSRLRGLVCRRKYRRMKQSHYSPSRGSSYRGQEYSPFVPVEADETTEFIQSVVNDVISKRDFDPHTWCKVICMEYDRPVAKFLVQNREVTIDGSHNAFDGNSVGLGVFRNPQRNRETEAIHGYLGKGITLQRDPDGSIWCKRLTEYDVIIQGYDDPANHCLSAEIVINKGHLPLGFAVKVFDMKELRSRIGLDMNRSGLDMTRLQNMCVICISLLTERPITLDTPCWLCVINMAALKSLRAPDVMSDVGKMMAEVELRTEEDDFQKEKAEDAKYRSNRKQWSKTDSRQNLVQTEGSSRKLRMALRKEGKSVGERMVYSWAADSRSNAAPITMDNLQEPIFGGDDYFDDFSESGMRSPPSRGRPREWAKVKASVKTAKAKEETQVESEFRDRMSRY